MNQIRLVKQLGLFSIGPVIGALLNFISVPLFAYFLSPEEFGKASIFSVAISVLQIIVFLGMDQAYVKRYYETDNPSKLLTNAIIPSLITITIIEVLLLVFLEQFSVLIFDSESEVSCIFALMIILPALAIERYALLGIRMSQRGALYSFMSVLLKVLVIISTILLLAAYKKSFHSIVFGNVLAQIVYVMIIFIFQRKFISIRLCYFDTKIIKSLLRFGLPLLPTAIIGWILSGFDKVMLRSMCDFTTLGLYTIAAKVTGILSIMQASFTIFWVPIAYQWNNEGNHEQHFVKTGRIITYVMSLVFIGILLVKDLIFLLFKIEYYNAVTIIPFLLFVPIMYTISEVTVMGIYFKERTSWTILISILAAGSNLILNYLLIPIFGANGAAIGTGLSYIVFFWSRTLLSRKLWFRFPINDYLLITIILIIVSVINTFNTSEYVYLINIISIILISFYFHTEISFLWNLFSRVFVKKRTIGTS